MSSYPKDQVELLQAVHDMRKAQNDYFQQRSDYRLKIAKAKEAAVDNLLRPLLHAGVIAAEKPNTNQGGLF